MQQQGEGGGGGARAREGQKRQLACLVNSERAAGSGRSGAEPQRVTSGMIHEGTSDSEGQLKAEQRKWDGMGGQGGGGWGGG